MNLNSSCIYTVHIKTDSPHAWEAPEFVKEGFSWPAFLFGMFWALYHRMWAVAAAFFGASILLSAFSRYFGGGELEDAVLMLSLQLAFAYVADDTRRHYLRRKGYIVADIVTGDSPLRAQQRFFERFTVSSHI